MAPAKSRPEPLGEIGTVLSVTPTGQITVRARGSRVPSEGTSVVDRSGQRIGRVSRVFGPVARPYLSVRPRAPLRPSEAAALLGSSLREG